MIPHNLYTLSFNLTARGLFMKNRKFRFVISLTVTVLLFVFVCYLAQCILMPKYTGIRKEGALISEYYDEVKDHDVIIIGDCEVYENISPMSSSFLSSKA